MQFDLGHSQKVFDECTSPLKFFLVKYIHVFSLVSYYFDPKLYIIIFLQMTHLQKLNCHVHKTNVN